MGSNRKRIFAIVLAVIAIVGIFKVSSGIQFAFNAMDPVDADTVIVSVRPGHSPVQLANELKEKKVISDVNQFIQLGRYLRKWGELKVGEYQLSAKMSPIAIFSVLTSGVSVAYRITIPEGQNMYQVADILEQKGLTKKNEFLKLCKDPKFISSLLNNLEPGITPPKTLEGYLFPDTYFFNKSLGTASIIKQMFGKFVENWNEPLKARAKELKLSMHQVVTLASIIEKETGAPEERPLISSVFHNRLDKKMRLASDPTTIYGIWETFDGNLRRSHLLEKNSYNTYAIAGLPTGPIANPGALALAAAVNPEKSEYLYFVSKNDGTHAFSTTLLQHNDAVKKYQLDRKERDGKSWRNLSERESK